MRSNGTHVFRSMNNRHERVGERAMARSLVVRRQERYELIDGFQRLRAGARQPGGSLPRAQNGSDIFISLG